jgi:hypothetical protein
VGETVVIALGELPVDVGSTPKGDGWGDVTDVTGTVVLGIFSVGAVVVPEGVLRRPKEPRQ